MQAGFAQKDGALGGRQFAIDLGPIAKWAEKVRVAGKPPRPLSRGLSQFDVRPVGRIQARRLGEIGIERLEGTGGRFLPVGRANERQTEDKSGWQSFVTGGHGVDV